MFCKTMWILMKFCQKPALVRSPVELSPFWGNRIQQNIYSPKSPQKKNLQSTSKLVVGDTPLTQCLQCPYPLLGAGVYTPSTKRVAARGAQALALHHTLTLSPMRCSGIKHPRMLQGCHPRALPTTCFPTRHQNPSLQQKIANTTESSAQLVAFFLAGWTPLQAGASSWVSFPLPKAVMLSLNPWFQAAYSP